MSNRFLDGLKSVGKNTLNTAMMISVMSMMAKDVGATIGTDGKPTTPKMESTSIAPDTIPVYLGQPMLEKIKEQHVESLGSIDSILQQAQQYVDSVLSQQSIVRMTDTERKIHIDVLLGMVRQLTSLHTPSPSLEEGYICGADTPVMQAMAKIYSLITPFRKKDKVESRVNSTDLDTHIWSLYGAGASATALDNSLAIYNNAPGITDGICVTSDETLLPGNVLPSFIDPASVGNIGAILGDFYAHLLDLDLAGTLPVADMYILSIPNSLALTGGTSGATPGVRCGDLNTIVMVGANTFPSINELRAHEVLFHGVSDTSPHTTTPANDIGRPSVAPGFLPSNAGTISSYNYELNNSSCINACYSLPIKLTHFDARYVSGEGVQLDWAIASAVNNDRMVVQHSLDGKTWTDISSCDIEGVGSTSEAQSYSCVHADPAVGVNYYRVKDVDYDGGEHYSNIQDVRIDKVIGSSFYTGANPVLSATPIVVDATDPVSIIDMLGRVVSTSNNGILQTPDQAGVYLLTDGTSTQKLIVQ